MSLWITVSASPTTSNLFDLLVLLGFPKAGFLLKHDRATLFSRLILFHVIYAKIRHARPLSWITQFAPFFLFLGRRSSFTISLIYLHCIG